MGVARYPEYKDSGVAWLGKLPKHWDSVPLKQAVWYWTSNVDKKSVEGQDPVLLCNYTDVYYNDTIESGMDFMAATATREQIERFTLKAGDTLITKDSETADDIAAPSYVPEDLPGVICGYHLGMMRPQPGTHGAFIKWLFDSAYIKAKAAVRANGLTRVGLGYDAVTSLNLPLPPIHEQQAIAAFLDHETSKIDALIAEQQRLIALLKEKRQAAISHAVTKGLNPNAPMKASGIPWLGELPEHWEVKQVRHFADVLRGKFTHRPRNDPAFYGGPYPFIQTGDITAASKFITGYKQTLNDQGISVSKLFPKGTLVMAIAANIGDVAILNFPAYFPDSIVGLAPDEFTDVMFLYYMMQAMNQPMLRNATVSTQMNLNVDQISSLHSACPPKHEQIQITEYLDSKLDQISQLISESKNVITLLQERRTALISATVTGKIDVRHALPEAAPA